MVVLGVVFKASRCRWCRPNTKYLQISCYFLSLQQAKSLRTATKLTCVSKLHSAFSISSCWWSPPRGLMRWASFIGWSQTTMKWCVRRRHRTRRCTPSYQDSTVCHRAIMFVHLLPVRPSTTGRTHNSVNSSTTVRVLMTYNRAARTTRLPQPHYRVYN